MPMELNPAATKKFFSVGASPSTCWSAVKLSGPLKNLRMPTFSSDGCGASPSRIGEVIEVSGARRSRNPPGAVDAHGFAFGSNAPSSRFGVLFVVGAASMSRAPEVEVMPSIGSVTM
jgi:hypothetical protein